MSRIGCAAKANTLTYETDLLEKTIRRIAGLLQVGFGEAGAQIIAQNLKVTLEARCFSLTYALLMSLLFRG